MLTSTTELGDINAMLHAPILDRSFSRAKNRSIVRSIGDAIVFTEPRFPGYPQVDLEAMSWIPMTIEEVYSTLKPRDGKMKCYSDSSPDAGTKASLLPVMVVPPESQADILRSGFSIIEDEDHPVPVTDTSQRIPTSLFNYRFPEAWFMTLMDQTPDREPGFVRLVDAGNLGEAYYKITGCVTLVAPPKFKSPLFYEGSFPSKTVVYLPTNEVQQYLSPNPQT